MAALALGAGGLIGKSMGVLVVHPEVIGELPADQGFRPLSEGGCDFLAKK
jgi:hypothetical protein